MSLQVRVCETAMVEVPDEILADILSRLPVKTLTRFKCVSKSWLSLVSSREFVKMHLRRALMGNLFTRVLTPNPLKSIDCETLVEGSHEEDAILNLDLNAPFEIMDDEMVKLLASHDGLIAFTVIKDVRMEDGDIYLWNPTTGLFRQLPKPASDLILCFYALGYDSKIDDYKLLRHGCCRKSLNGVGFVIEVLPLRANAWRHVLKAPLTGTPFSAGVFLNKAVHWVDTKGRIVAFDLENENFMRFPPCSVNGEGVFCIGLSVHRGCLVTCLCYIDSPDSPFEAWMMKEYGAESTWTKLFDISLEKLLCDYNFPLVWLIAIVGKGNAYALVGYESKFFLYDVKKETYKEIPVERRKVWREPKVYVETLVSPFTEDGNRSYCI